MRKAGPPRDIPPPLEMLCLKALWSLGEGNVSEVRRVVGESKPLAYTTVMTVLDRLARRNIVSRHKAGRAYVYAPLMSKDSMRRLALKEFVECFFDGSEEMLAQFLRRGGQYREVEADAGMDAALL
jgi:predicted transcriptional regulator